MDYDPEERILYTGDEMGYMHKWDMNQLLDKLDLEKEQEKQSKLAEKQGAQTGGAFITGLTG